jgi:hypothetical protein
VYTEPLVEEKKKYGGIKRPVSARSSVHVKDEDPTEIDPDVDRTQIVPAFVPSST